MNDPPPAWAILALGLSLAVFCAVLAVAGMGLIATRWPPSRSGTVHRRSRRCWPSWPRSWGRGRPEAFRRPEWLENDRARERAARAEPNLHYTGPPPQGGWPMPELEAVAGEALPPAPESAYPPDATPLAEVRADIHAAGEAVLGARDSVRAALAKLREPPAAPTEAAGPIPAEEESR